MVFVMEIQKEDLAALHTRQTRQGKIKLSTIRREKPPYKRLNCNVSAGLAFIIIFPRSRLILRSTKMYSWRSAPDTWLYEYAYIKLQSYHIRELISLQGGVLIINSPC